MLRVWIKLTSDPRRYKSRLAVEGIDSTCTRLTERQTVCATVTPAEFSLLSRDARVVKGTPSACRDLVLGKATASLQPGSVRASTAAESGSLRPQLPPRLIKRSVVTDNGLYTTSTENRGMIYRGGLNV